MLIGFYKKKKIVFFMGWQNIKYENIINGVHKFTVNSIQINNTLIDTDPLLGK